MAHFLGKAPKPIKQRILFVFFMFFVIFGVD